ncbi:putative nuclease HARBI1 [Anastrepha ludens]|uniref:putative nuclease HARBI1 n=1 Tax=Anastrepha ludens TaxID=28586 RepID=UPI0023AEB80A|nr:putative nuclease HARBI1 [Anastrepha ludens]
MHTKAVPAVLQLAACLSLLASGGYQHAIGNDYLIGICQSTVSKLTGNVLEEIEAKLCPKHIKFEPDDSRRCKDWFVENYQIPGVVGCIDGTHIGLQKPTVNEHMYFNRKGFHSINAMLICDHTTKILAINCQYGGAAHDSFIWKHSNERMVMEHRFLHNRSDNAWLLGDSGYPLEPWCITPYRNPSDGSGEARFNEIHSKARCIIERTNGVLKGRWRILEYNKRGKYDPIKVARFANVCAALHNICIQFNVSFTATNSESQTASDIVSGEGQYTRIGQTIRDQIKISLMNST